MRTIGLSPFSQKKRKKVNESLGMSSDTYGTVSCARPCPGLCSPPADTDASAIDQDGEGREPAQDRQQQETVGDGEARRRARAVLDSVTCR